ncbi:hypothetical protein NIES592_08785 [Fischerella major NIES-592]|uniref:DUF2513 domain-containing protein n=2 Tax=Fischerella TaxID=1190 RepID=A0A1U7H1T8_9CYAN|nr:MULTISPECIES: hypothetical protein [Fischerella]OKH14959.1 hypothetical protein NIES592_08785 [Fischerella major NIES-592]PMB42753.1 hypothetical protein CEN41_14485 [Fischerella thermalis CCMEE 5330]BAU05760.1 hypothetical protein FIS3754_16670 [Fischerella sp. NIES-3754]BCX08033.1 MAG: hypothetical protein KatS3mg066_1892 [Fischerella sp.]
MQLNRNIVQQVLEIAAEQGEAGFEEKDIAHLFGDEYDLVFHLDYLHEKGFITGEFTPGAYAAFAILPEPIHFIRGKITAEGQQYLQGLQQSSEVAMES